MREVGARDRLVMAGLVVLGLLTVIAGVLSGRSTINYVLARDAREAALSWARDLNKSLSETGPHAPQLLDRKLDILNVDGFAAQSGKPATLPSSSTSKQDFTLVEDLDRLTAFADYIVPAALRVLGITRYSDELEAAIREGRPIEAGSPWEVEIRAHTIYACDELTGRVNEQRPPELQAIVPQVDARLWVPFHRTHYPHHLTRTIYY